MRTLISITILTSIILSSMYVNSHSLNHFTRNNENLAFLQNVPASIKDEKVFEYNGDLNYNFTKMLNDFEANDYNKVIINYSYNEEYFYGSKPNVYIAPALKTLSNLTYFEFYKPSREFISLVFDALAGSASLNYFHYETNDSAFKSLTDAEIQSFIKAFENKTTLTNLNLSNFDLKSEILAKVLVKTPNLTHFTTSISDFNMDHTAFFKALCTLTKLKYLNIQDTNLDKDDKSVILGEALSNMSELTYLHLANLPLFVAKDTTISNIIKGLLNNKNLEYLSLEGFFYQNFSPLIGELLKNQDNLAYLSISVESIKSERLSREITESILISLKNKVNLKYLKLTNLTINSQKSSDYLSSALASMKNLEELVVADSLFENCFVDFQAVGHNDNLKKLSFISTNLDVQSAESLSYALSDFPNLSQINLFGNNLRMIGSALIMRALDNRTNIDYLNIRENNIESDVAILASSVIVSSKLNRQYGFVVYRTYPSKELNLSFKIELSCFQSDKYNGELNQGKIETYYSNK